MEESKVHNGRHSRRKSFIEALREKYCFHEYECQNNFVIKMVFHGRPKNKTDAELGHLRNVVLSNSFVGYAGLPSNGLASVCPNVVDLDISGNFLENWDEILPIVLQLPRLKFLNLSRNQLNNAQLSFDKFDSQHDCIENLVLNNTGLSWRKALSLTNCMPALKELHVCGNGYKELWMEDIDVLTSVECLRLNNNHIQNWGEIWKLRHLPKLTSLILSGNPLRSIFFRQKQSKKSLNDNYNDNVDIFQDCEKTVHELLTQIQINEGLSDATEKYQNSNETSEETNNNSSFDEFSVNAANDSCQNKNTEDVDDTECERFLNHILSEACRQLEVLYDRRKKRMVADSSCRDAGKGSHVTDNYSKMKNSRESTSAGDAHDINFRHFTNSNLLSLAASSVKGDNSRGNSGIFVEEKEVREDTVPFSQLKSVCMNDTSIAYWQSIEALRQYPCLQSLRITDVTLWSDMTQDDRRKLLIACLPDISILNGSEVSVTEREKAERHFLRYYCDKQEKPDRYAELQAKHGTLEPLVDIDIRRGFQEWAIIHVVCDGKRVATESVRVVEPIYKLREQITWRLHRYASLKSFTMYHLPCGPYHTHDIPEDMFAFAELRCESLPMSRLDIMEGDEIHIDPCDDFDKWPYSQLMITNYL